MPRKRRIEIAGGLYHVITRGNNRQTIFHEAADYEKFLGQLQKLKSRWPFYLYAYCLMPNHVHLFIERQATAIGRLMHRLLTGYSQYYNRKYRRIGHVLQGRHKAILCQSERYLSELVRYIHLNPVRAGIVRCPEEYRYSSHRSYLGLEPAGIVDVDPVLRHFGARRKLARERYRKFVAAGIKVGHQDEFYQAEDGRILGTEEFVDAAIHRIGEVKAALRRAKQTEAVDSFDGRLLLSAVERICGMARSEFCGPGKRSTAIVAKEAVVLIGRKLGASCQCLSELTGISSSAVSRRYDVGKDRMEKDPKLRRLLQRIEWEYTRSVKETFTDQDADSRSRTHRKRLKENSKLAITQRRSRNRKSQA